MCIIDHNPLEAQRTKISGGLNISEKLILRILYVYNGHVQVKNLTIFA